MITLSKLEKIPRKTRLRKIVQLLKKAELDILKRREIDREYYRKILELAEKDLGSFSKMKGETSQSLDTAHRDYLLRIFNDMRHIIQAELGITAAEWDFIDTDEISEKNVTEKRLILPIEVFLEDVRSPYNVGAIFRTAEAFGVSGIVLSASTPPPTHTRASRTSRGTHRIVKWRYGNIDEMEKRENVFALEEGGTPIGEFTFPEKGTVLVGSEELGLSPEALDIARKSRGIVSIPMFGVKRSLNVSVAFGILLYVWTERIVRSSSA